MQKAGYAAGEADPNDEHFARFLSRPDISAPKWNITVFDADALAPGGYWFLSPYAHLDQVDYPLWNGPLIYDARNGELVWSGAPLLEHINTFDFRVVEVDGKQMLSLVAPHPPRSRKKEHNPQLGHGNFEGIILDDNYNVYTTIDLRRHNPKPNMHDLVVRENGTRALMLTQKKYDHVSTVRLGKFKLECKVGWQGFREVDIQTNKILFQWDAEDHIDPLESTKHEASYKEMCDDHWDILHFNSVDKFDDGNYLLSARHSDTIYKVSHVDGSIIWRLGGLRSDFQFKDKDATFTRQHHARVRGQNETHTLISLFNNAAGSGESKWEQPSHNESSGLLIALRTDQSPMTVELVTRWPHPNGRISGSRGSVTFLENGNAFIGWVYSSVISEHTHDGRLLMQASLRYGENTYRAYKLPWVGRPSQPPDVKTIARRTTTGSIELLAYVSWNGATEVATWELLRAKTSETITSTPRTGFETTLVFDGFAEFVIAVARDRDGNEIGRSKTIRVSLPSDADALHTVPSNKETEGDSTNDDTAVQTTSTVATQFSNVSASKLPTDSQNSFWEVHTAIAFVAGFFACLLAGICLWFAMRAKTGWNFVRPWLSSRSPEYRAVPEDEDELIESQARMSRTKATM